MITRVRIEASGESIAEIQGKLLAAWTALKEHTGGEWDIEDEKVQTTKKGYWGFVIIRRKGH